VELDGRMASGGYRYGFNGKEKTDEISGAGNSYDFGARLLDPRLARWFKLDNKSELYAFYSPYTFCENSPLLNIDPDGNVVVLYDIQGIKVATISKSGIIIEKGMENSELLMQYNEAKNYIFEYSKNDVFHFLENDDRNLEIYAFDKINSVGKFTNSGYNITSINYIDNSDEYLIEEVKTVEYANPDQIGKIYWSPNTGAEDSEENNHSPAMILLHEMIHAKHFSENLLQFVKDRKSKSGNNGTLEEVKTMNECNEVSKSLPNNDGGNGVDRIRISHSGSKSFKTSSTISNVNPNEWE
jgi:RHS repeat-associated protein